MKKQLLETLSTVQHAKEFLNILRHFHDYDSAYDFLNKALRPFLQQFTTYQIVEIKITDSEVFDGQISDNVLKINHSLVDNLLKVNPDDLNLFIAYKFIDTLLHELLHSLQIAKDPTYYDHRRSKLSNPKLKKDGKSEYSQLLKNRTDPSRYFDLYYADIMEINAHANNVALEVLKQLKSILAYNASLTIDAVQQSIKYEVNEFFRTSFSKDVMQQVEFKKVRQDYYKKVYTIVMNHLEKLYNEHVAEQEVQNDSGLEELIAMFPDVFDKPTVKKAPSFHDTLKTREI